MLVLLQEAPKAHAITQQSLWYKHSDQLTRELKHRGACGLQSYNQICHVTQSGIPGHSISENIIVSPVCRGRLSLQAIHDSLTSFAPDILR